MSIDQADASTKTSPRDDDERELLRRVRAGEPRAFEALVRLHGGRMMAVASRFLRNEHEREDAVQEAFVSALRAIDRFDEKSALSTWLHRITVNACLMRIRSRSRKPEASIDELLPAFDDTGHQTRRTPAWNGDAHEKLEASEVRQQVRDCIDRLPESYRVVLLLRDIEELDTAETAKRLNTTAANVKTRLHRARQALRTLLEPIFANR
jgi:RNA polymerase sigma-70 factor (ECF subfamily)